MSTSTPGTTLTLKMKIVVAIIIAVVVTVVVVYAALSIYACTEHIWRKPNNSYY